MFTSFTRRHFLLASVTTFTVALFIWQSQSVDPKQSNTVNTTAKAFTKSTSTKPKSEFTPAALKDKLNAKNKLQKVKLPLHFEANQGQYPKGVEFASRTKEFQLFLQGTQARMLIPVKIEQSDLADDVKMNIKTDHSLAARKGREATKPAKISYAEVRMQPIGANQNSTWRGDDKQVGISSYFSGNDPKQWQTKVAHYGSVRYDNLYKGIDLKYYGNPQQLEYDFIVKPGADPSVIKLGFEGIDHITIDKKGDAQLKVQGKTLTQHAPIAYQLIDGKKQNIEASYTLLNKPLLKQQTEQKREQLEQKKNKPIQLGIQLASYNPEYELVIDPVISYSTYLDGGGSLESEDDGNGVAIDDSGAMYITGYSYFNFFSSGSAQTNNPQIAFNDLTSKVFVSKISPSGDQLLWTIFLDGSQYEFAYGIAVDSAGQAHITGFTSSSDFPTINAYDYTLNGFNDAFVAKIKADGSGLIYSRFLGGSNYERAFAIAIDNSDEVYVTGRTNSTDFPIIGPGSFGGGSYDAFVTKLNTYGAIVYSTYLGGTNTDQGNAIAVDSAKQAYVAGETNSSNFPTMYNGFGWTLNSNGDGFVTKINATGTNLVYSGFLGGGSSDIANAIAVDSLGQAYVTGSTVSTDFPLVNSSTSLSNPMSGNPDAFVSKINSSGTELVYSRYLSGTGIDYGNAIAVNDNGNAYVAGVTDSNDFPVLNAFQATSAGAKDSFITNLNPDGSIYYSSYLGGSDSEYTNGIALDDIGQVYISGYTYSSNFPMVNTLDSSGEVFVTKITSDDSPLSSLISPIGYTTESPTNFNWTHVSDPTWYKLEVTNDDGTVTHHSTWYKKADICSAGECSKQLSDLPNGHNQWRIRGWKNGGNFEWTQYKPFQLAVTAPTKPTLVSPLDTGSTLPTYTWNAVAGANWYYLYVTDTANGSGRIKKWYSAVTAGCDASSTCSITPTTTVGGAVNWWIKAWNSAGYSPWSSGMTFYTAVPGAATLVSPVGTGSGNPTYTWNAVADSTYYKLHVNDSTGGGVIDQWYSSTSANCIPNGLCSITPATTVTGSVRWWLQTYNKAGEGAWTSPSMDFTAP